MKSVIFFISLLFFLPVRANSSAVDINFVVLTRNEQAHKKATVTLLQKEVEILNTYFVSDTKENLLTFNFKSAYVYNDIKNSECDFIRLGDSKEPYDVKRVKHEYFSCNDVRVRDPKAINFYIIDSYSPKYGYEKYTTSRGAFNNGAQPFVLLDWMRLDHNILSPEEHEMGHAFGLFHECHEGAAKETHTNIMASSSDCAGSIGLRDLGFNATQVQTIRRNLRIIIQNFNLDRYQNNEEKIYRDTTSVKDFSREGGTLYTDLQAKDYQFCYIYDKFRIFYSLEGQNKIINVQDVNRNGVVDSIESLMKQLVFSKFLLNNVFFLQDPLNYANSHFILENAQFIDIKVRKIKSRAYTSNKKVLSNFLITKRNQLHHGAVISITIKNSFTNNDLVLFHEMLHVYQNVKTKLRNDWFSEGSARWMENSLLGISFEDYILPQDVAALSKLTKSGYSAAKFWNRLSQSCQQEEKNKFDNNFLKDIGYSDITINDSILYNSQFYRVLLDNLQYQSLKATSERGLPNYLIWPADEEKSAENNTYLLKALQQTINSTCTPHDRELRGFLEGIDLFEKNNQSKN